MPSQFILEGGKQGVLWECAFFNAFFNIIPSLTETQLQEIISYLFRGLRMFSPARLTTASHSGKGDWEISFYLR